MFLTYLQYVPNKPPNYCTPKCIPPEASPLPKWTCHHSGFFLRFSSSHTTFQPVLLRLSTMHLNVYFFPYFPGHHVSNSSHPFNFTFCLIICLYIGNDFKYESHHVISLHITILTTCQYFP